MLFNQFEIFFYSLAVAFFISKIVVFAWIPELNRKPFNCMGCCTGWAALVLGLISGYGLGAILLCIGGVFIGAIVESIYMRWL
jgi:hypothetical protein